MRRLIKNVVTLSKSFALYLRGVRLGDNYLDVKTGELSQYQGSGRWRTICVVNITSDAPDYILIL